MRTSARTIEWEAVAEQPVRHQKLPRGYSQQSLTPGGSLSGMGSPHAMAT